MNIAEIDKTSMTERLQFMEALWNSMLRETANIPSPDWHAGEIDKRVQKIEEGRADFVSVDELRKNRPR